MLGIIQRMIWKRVLIISLSIWLLLAVLVIFNFIVEELNTNHEHYTTLEVITVAFLRVPQIAWILFNPSMIIGIVVSVGLLSSSGELIAIRSIGVSFYKIFFMSVAPLFIVSLIFVFVYDKWLASMDNKSTALYRLARDSEGTTIPAISSLFFDSGRGSNWYKEDDSFIFVRKVRTDNQNRDIYFLNKLDKLSSDGSIIGNTVSRLLYYDAETMQWFMNPRRTKSIEIKDSQIAISPPDLVDGENNLAKADVNIDFDLIKFINLTNEDMNFNQLLLFTEYSQSRGINNSIYEQTFYKRLLLPFKVVFTALLGFSFLFSSNRSVSVGKKIFIGTLIAIGVEIIFAIVEQLNGLLMMPGWLTSLEIFIICVLISQIYLRWKLVV